MDDLRMYLRAGQNFTVVYQKNADHWASATPGDFTGCYYIYLVFYFLALFTIITFDFSKIYPTTEERSLEFLARLAPVSSD